MTPIKTLEDYKEQFYVSVSAKMPDGSEELATNNTDVVWNMFEHIFSSLTQQMIPEEEVFVPNSDSMRFDSNFTLEVSTRGFNRAISEMKARRKKILK